GLVPDAVVLHHLVRLKDVAAYLVAPTHFDVLPLDQRLLLGALLQLALEQPRLQDAHSRLFVPALRALILTRDDEPRRDVGDPDGRRDLLHVLTAVAGRVITVAGRDLVL